uniref:Uncharacterized protein n=1 Tax=Micrurus paraensis TaxID=1970185 RepID=A0A2D4L7B3_9SAUR
MLLCHVQSGCIYIDISPPYFISIVLGSASRYLNMCVREKERKYICMYKLQHIKLWLLSCNTTCWPISALQALFMWVEKKIVTPRTVFLNLGHSETCGLQFPECPSQHSMA